MSDSAPFPSNNSGASTRDEPRPVRTAAATRMTDTALRALASLIEKGKKKLTEVGNHNYNADSRDSVALEEQFKYCRDRINELESNRRTILCSLGDVEAVIFRIGDADAKTDAEKQLVTAKKVVEEHIANVNSAVSVLESNQAEFSRAKGEQSEPRMETPEATESERIAIQRTEASQSRTHLPKMELPRFSGITADWRQFLQIFESTMRAEKLTNLEKLRYLMGCLEGRAKEVVSGYAITEDAYNNVLQALKDEYGDSDLVKVRLHAQLRTLGKASESIASTHRVIMESQRIVRQLQQLGENTNHPMMENSIMEKLPQWLNKEILKFKRVTIDPTVDKILDFAMSEIKDQRTVEEVAGGGLKVRVNTIQKGQPERYGTERNEKKFPDKRRQQQEWPCQLCGELGHIAVNCTRYTTQKERKDAVIAKKLCFRCLRGNHQTRACRRTFGCKNCKGNHNEAICDRPAWQSRVNTVLKGEQNRTTTDQASVILPTCKAMILNLETGKKRMVAFLLDSGSETSFIKESTAKALKLEEIRRGRIVISTLNGQKTTIDSTEYLVGLKERNGNVKQIVVHSAPVVTHRLPIVNSDTQEMDHAEPEILLGADVFWDVVEYVRSRMPSGLTVVQTTLGRVTTGKTSTDHMDGEELVHLIIEDEKTLDALSRDMFRLEAVGILDDPEENANEQAKRIFYEKINRREDGRYAVSYLWREPNPPMASNRFASIKRLESLVKRLREGNQLSKYNSTIGEQLDQGIIEVVDERAIPEGPVWYAPHHAVIHKAKPNKPPRIVHDASCGGRGRSLNSHLYAGPNLIPKIFDILLQMRTKKIIITADIAKAFNQLELNKEDRDAMRFIWLKDVNKPVTEENLMVLRFCRVPFGVICAPYLLQETIQHHLREEGTPLAQEIAKQIYADNIVMAAETTEEAKEKCIQAKEIFAKAHMPLREYFSNDLAITKEFGDDPTAAPKTKFLGVEWNLETDELCIRSGPAEIEQATKKIVLTTSASVWDPTGLASPALLQARIFFQKILEKGWDEHLNAEEQPVWQEIANDLHEKQFTLPRRVTLDNNSELHIFTDASKVGYGVAVYVRSKTGGEIRCSLLAAKSKVAPAKKKITIPQMELLGVEIGTALAKHVKESLAPNAKVILWTDNKPVIEWIRDTKDKSHGKFVQNRVIAIKRNASIDVFRYVPTLDNPADLCSRGMKMEELDQCKLWKEGPLWLSKEEGHWPRSAEGEVLKTNEINEDTLTDIEMKVNAISLPRQSNIVKMERFRDLNRALNSTSYVLRFIRNLARKANVVLLVIDGMHDSQSANGVPNASERKKALKALLRMSSSENPPSTKEINEHNLTEGIDGLWRSSRRMGHSDLPEEARLPVFVSRKSPLAALLVQDAHTRMFHGGIPSTVSALRSAYCVPQPRQLARSVIAKCAACRRRKTAKPFHYPDMGELPAERTRRHRVFDNVGVDLLGPSRMKEKGKEEKVWIALFSCMASRAIHLELIEDLSASTFIMALRKFVARRGRPTKIISDNATNFTLTAQSIDIWKEINDDEELKGYVAKESINWEFIPPRAPWRGGFYERSVALVKEAIKGAIGNKSLSRKEMETLVVEVEAVVNCRPLTTDDDGNPLRPIDFLSPLAMPGVPQMDHDDDNDYEETNRNQLLKMWRSTTKILDKFWDKWRSLYLTELRDRQKTKFPQGRSVTMREPVVNEVVLVVDDQLPRGEWRIARIEELIPGRDGAIRTAKIRMANGRTTTRGVNHLIPLEQNVVDNEIKELEKEMSPMSLIETDCVYGDDVDIPEPVNDSGNDGRNAKIEATGKNRKRKKELTEAVQEGHRYHLRPRKAHAMLAVTLMMIIGSVEAFNCPGNSPPSTSRVEYIESCTPSGLIVYRRSDDSMCYTMTDCRARRKVLQDPMKTGGEPCGPVCRCPEWASGCSFFNGPYTTNSTETHLMTRKLLDEAGVEACSWGKPKKGCDKTPIETDAYQIELYDGTKHQVRDLRLRTHKVMHFWCIGGSRRSGTPDYCKKNKCDDNPNGFCTIPRMEMTFLQWHDESVAIKAWGIARVRYFGFPRKDAREEYEPQRAYESPRSNERKPNKEKPRRRPTKKEKEDNQPKEKTEEKGHFGSFARMNQERDVAKGESYRNPIEQYMPKWNGKCEKMDLINLDCWTWWMTALAAIGLYVILFILAVITKIVCLITDTVSCLRTVCCFTARTLRSTVRWTKGKARTATRSMPARALIFIATIIGGLHACDRTLAITAKQNECAIKEDGSMKCKISQVMDVDNIPTRATICILFETPEGVISGDMTKISVKEVITHCTAEETLFYTKAHKTSVASMKRCPEMGSCRDMDCATIGTQDRIPELGAAADYPGHTYCRESCSCLPCGCFLCSPGCLFYRVHAISTEEPWTTVSQCRQEAVEAELEIQEGKEDPSVTVLKAREQWQLERMTRAIKAIQEPPKVQGSNILRGESTAIVSNDQLREIQGLQCPTKNFTACHLRETACRCEAFKELVNCNCDPVTVSSIRQDQALPKEVYGTKWEDRKGRIAANRRDTTVTLRIIAEDLLVTAYHKQKCQFKNGPLTGCAGCEEGAKFDYTCKSNQPMLAILSCPQWNPIPIECGKEEERSARINHEEEHVKERCKFTCGGEEESIVIEGSLKKNKIKINEGVKADQSIPSVSGEFKLDIPNLFPEIDTFVYCIISVIIIIALAGVCSVRAFI